MVNRSKGTFILDTGSPITVDPTQKKVGLEKSFRDKQKSVRRNGIASANDSNEK